MSEKKLLIIIAVFLSVATNLFSQKQQIAEVDSVVMAYYRKCLGEIRNPVVLSMADTLYQMAEHDGDKRMQAVALCTKIDYYYYSQGENKRDSLIAWVNRVQAFARETHQPKYYYFVWGQRLIIYYLSQGEYNIALLEAEKMLKEAEQDDYREGIAECYACLASIFSSKRLYEKELEFTLKEIELFEKYNLERYNISAKYSTAARMLIEKGEYTQAKEYIEKAFEQVQIPLHKLYADIACIRLELEKGNLEETARLLDECRQMIDSTQLLTIHKHHLYNVETDYYRATKQYKKALEAWENTKNATMSRGQDFVASQNLVVKGNIYWEMGQKELAADIFKEYIELMEEEKAKNEEITTAEFSTLLNLQRLSAEKTELEEKVREDQLRYTQTILILLLVLLFIIVFFFIRQRKLNAQLRKSRDILDDKNRVLLRAEEELRTAKEAAEESSRMKTVFIQNMSHEIRTPLNSIVGFSTLLSEMFSEESEDIKLYSETIEKNSQLLLKMINDILVISDLDRDNLFVEHEPVNINGCCQRAVEMTEPLLHGGVTLLFEPLSDNLVIESNEELLIQILNNLLSNAAKFTDTGSISFVLDLNRQHQKLRFVITDTGIGIPADKQEYVFQRFTKLDDFSQGTGLGLPICRLAAEKLGGSLILDKDYAKGARFILEIPFQ